jgi:hypothetical protein
MFLLIGLMASLIVLKVEEYLLRLEVSLLDNVCFDIFISILVIFAVKKRRKILIFITNIF